MSYEGYSEYLCEKGHYFNCDIYADERKKCPQCKSKLAYCHAVDQTNGYIEDNPSTKPAPVKKIGFEDKWQKDHYGNKYAIKIPLYAPKNNSKEWRKINDNE